MKAQIEGDIIRSLVEDPAPGVDIPEEFVGADRRELRFDGKTLVHLSDYKRFYIDASGVRHITKLEEDWQRLDCSWNTELVRDGDRWRERTDEDDKADKVNGLLATAGQLRSSIEAEGIDFQDKRVATTPDAVLKLATERMAVMSGDREDGEPFAFADGSSASLANDDIVALNMAVRARARAIATKAEEVATKIRDGKITNEAQIEAALRSAAK